jgi:hypothetical protein
MEISGQFLGLALLPSWKEPPVSGRAKDLSLLLSLGAPSLLCSGYRKIFPRSVKLTVHLHLVPSSRIVELYLHSHISLHSVIIN